MGGLELEVADLVDDEQLWVGEVVQFAVEFVFIAGPAEPNTSALKTLDKKNDRPRAQRPA
ncbi:MAG: hypothetical protein ACOZE5_09870 [Verrucomicrobiota bacterium]